MNWSIVTKEHIEKAIQIFLAQQPEYPEPKNTFLEYNGMYLPAKHIRGMAYKVATGHEVSKEEYTGGKETKLFFEKRGFKVLYQGKQMEKENKEARTATKLPETTADEKVNLKIGLWSRISPTVHYKVKEKCDRSFYETLEVIKNADMDLVVLPETCNIPNELYEEAEKDTYFDPKDSNEVKQLEINKKLAMNLSKRINKAIIIGRSFNDKDGAVLRIYNIYANANASEEETDTCTYFKHTMTYFSWVM